MKSIGDWFLPGYTSRAHETIGQAKTKASAGAVAIATCHEIILKTVSEFALHVELIQDLQDRLAQYEGTSSKSIVHKRFMPITLKATQSDGVRTITGMASTGTVDRMGDICEPLGARIKLPVPLLLQHDHSQPVGLVRSATPTAKGIPFTAIISEVNEPGPLKTRTDEAWQLIQHGLITGVSIGFRASKSEALKGGGLRFIEWELLELSLVTIPANPEAIITGARE